MSPDDIDDLVFKLHNLLVAMDRVPDDDDDYCTISAFVHDELDKFCTRDRNWN